MKGKTKILVLLAVGALTGFGLIACAGSRHGGPPATVEVVDLKRYSGTWHEIARLPNWFQRNCAGPATATYTPLEDGRIRVVNVCTDRKGREQRVEGAARVVPNSGNSKLKVTFQWPFTGDYWILALDDDYRWALVGHPSRKFLWILARERSLPPDVYERIVAAAVARGYDVSQLKSWNEI